MSAFTFDEPSHSYFLGGERIPGVTETLSATGLRTDYSRVPHDVLERKLEIGRDAHLACHFDDEGDLDETTVRPEVVPYLDAWRLYRAERGFVPILLETRLYHPLYRYAGTLDRFGYDAEGLVLPDIKTVYRLEDAGAAWQTAAYLEALRACPETPQSVRDALSGDSPVRRAAVQLKPDGRYHEAFYKNYQDFRVFVAAVLVYHNQRSRTPDYARAV